MAERNLFDEARLELAAIVKDAAQRYPFIMQGLISKEFGVRQLTDNYREGKTDKPFTSATARNRTNKLRIAQGKLYQSFAPGNKNNIFRIEARGAEIIVHYGTIVEYAAIHEFGGTIQHPGVTPYIVKSINGQPRAIFLKKDGKYPKNVKFTKPHIITIKARAYFNPAQEKFKTNGLPQLNEFIFERLRQLIEKR